MRSREVQRNVRVGLRKMVQSRHEPQRRKTRGAVHVEAVADALTHIVGGRRDRCESSRHPGKILLSSGAESHPVRTALEQLDPEGGLEPCDLVTYSRRRDVELGSGQRKAAPTRDCFKREQVWH